MTPILIKEFETVADVDTFLRSWYPNSIASKWDPNLKLIVLLGTLTVFQLAFMKMKQFEIIQLKYYYELTKVSLEISPD
jgi:hypothetical protein